MSTKNKPLDGLFAQLQDIKDADGKLMNTILFSKNGNPSVIIEIENPVQQYATDAVQYVAYTDVLNNIVQTLGEGYALQKLQRPPLYRDPHLPHHHAGGSEVRLREVRPQVLA